MSVRVAVLGGGPDAERDVSLESSAAIAKGLQDAGVDAELVVIDKPDSLSYIKADVLFPALHGRWGEGGPLQDILEADGRPYVGCGPRAARFAMDKIAAKLVASQLGIRTPPAVLVNPEDRVGMNLPYVIKPALEGSSVGLHICETEADAVSAIDATRSYLKARPGQVAMVEKLILGREITCPVLERDGRLQALPLVEIAPADGVYDYEAKYKRDDTVYTVEPAGIDTRAIAADTERFAAALGVRHLARADFIVDEACNHWLLEINTLPGFTAHSLVPQAAARVGLPMPELCAHLVHLALTGHESGSTAPDSSLSPR